MSRDYMNPAEVPEDVAYSLRAIRAATERIAEAVERLPQRPIAVIELPADFSAGSVAEVVARLRAALDEAPR